MPARSGRSWRPRFRLRYLALLLVAWIVFLVAVPIYAWTRVDEVVFAPGGDRPEEQKGTTYLMVGSDSREGLTPEERKALGTGNAAGQRTDTIMLLHTGSGPNLLMSIPRDSLVEIPDRGTTKINAAYAFGGPKLLVKTIERNTGIHIDEYVEIGIGGFVGLVDAVGGVEICPEKAMKDPLANLDVEAGCQEADGSTALGYARSRKTYTALGDVQRAQAQREVVSSVGSEVLSPWSVLNPVRYWRLNMAATDTVEFGKGMTPWRAGLWAMAMTRVNGDKGLTCGVPISDLAVNWDPDRAPQMFQAIIDDDTDRIGQGLCSPSGLAKGTTG
ncbi:Regulatory protein MsrR [Nocardioides dokdonensis FR1436]|uniref:Regulatory protein MsrR n=1 Tax=Nocardioides dokdonensis FR1436 TaxID=1300347 RepID=A0A1A9GG53_9ACTN|nr:Regulatory protein MsrR [Nocardioides dokdonensis FR1436]